MYVSRENRAVLLEPSPLVAQLFPSALRMPDGRVVLPHGLQTWKVLRSRGVSLPHPLLTYYDWCDGDPFKTQKLTCMMLVNNPRAYVLNSMGTGKTRSALWAWDYLNREGLAKKLLVVCPLSTTELTWAREIFEVMPHRKCAVLTGSRAKRLNRLGEDVDIFIINHDGVEVIATELHQYQEIDSIVIDEISKYRNADTNRNKVIRKLAAPMHWVWGMTGTPMPNCATDVYGQCKIITPQSVPKYFSHFRDQLQKRISTYEWVDRPNARELAYQCMQPSVRFTLDDVVELPPVVERDIAVPMTPEQESAYKQLKSVYHVLIQEKQITALNAAAAMTKLLQVSAGWVYAGDDVATIDAIPRVQALLELIEECERKVIVFATFRHIVNGLEAVFLKEKVKHVKVFGGMTDKQRNDRLSQFKSDPSVKVLLAHPACMSHGLNLTEANTIIWYCPTASNETYEQADARIRRVGQTHKQQVIHLSGSPVERRVYSLLRRKQANQKAFLQMFEENGNGQ